MNKHIVVLLNLLFLAFACGQKNASNNYEPLSQDSINIDYFSLGVKSSDDISPSLLFDFNPIKINSTDLTEKVFEFASWTHYTDSCSFYFECDCCSATIAFNSDKTFFYKSYCSSDLTLTYGDYCIKNDSLRLNFSGHSYNMNYNHMHEIDSLTPEYTMFESNGSKSTVHFLGEKCDNKLKLNDLGEGFIMLESAINYLSFINFYRTNKEKVIINK